ncbi:twin-arginine translocase subunit TatB [Corynebacterium sp. 13CS0277]|nr:twin-arginine translocase subunit TatB [Corynebacterium sp. 13CS0277]
MGWFEIAVVFIAGLIIIGPERLPRVIEDARAAIYAARKAIDNAKKELAGELGPEFDTITEPLKDLQRLRGMTPRAMVTRTLLDGDDTFLDAFDPKKIMAEGTAGAAQRQRNYAGDTPETHRVARPDSRPGITTGGAAETARGDVTPPEPVLPRAPQAEQPAPPAAPQAPAPQTPGPQPTQPSAWDDVI